MIAMVPGTVAYTWLGYADLKRALEQGNHTT